MFDKRGYSLVEILLASTMALVVLAAVVSVYLSGLGIQRAARESYYISQNASLALTQISSDFQMTALHSVKVWPDGVSMLSPVDMGSNKGFELTPFGGPAWKKSVHYKIQRATDKTSDLVRWETPVADPLLPPSIANPGLPDAGGRALLNGLLSPGQAIKPRSDGVYELAPDKDSEGGFQVKFVRNDGTFSTDNPAAFSDHERPHWTAGNTNLIEVRLTVLTLPSDSKVNCLEMIKRYYPRHP